MSSDLLTAAPSPAAFIIYYSANFDILWNKELSFPFWNIQAISYDPRQNNKVFAVTSVITNYPTTILEIRNDDGYLQKSYSYLSTI